MKNIKMKVYLKIISFSVLYFIAFTAYGQNNPTKFEKWRALRTAVKNFSLSIGPISFSPAFALAQHPKDLTTFIVSSGATNTLPNNFLNEEGVRAIKHAIEIQGLVWSWEVKDLILITEYNTNMYTTISYPSKVDDYGQKAFNVHISPLPDREYPRLHVHAEMAIVSYFGIYEPEHLDLPEDIVMVAQLKYCCRCYNYLRINNFYTPSEAELDSTHNDQDVNDRIYISGNNGMCAVPSAQFWSLPNYFRTNDSVFPNMPNMSQGNWVNPFNNQINNFGANYYIDGSQGNFIKPSENTKKATFINWPANDPVSPVPIVPGQN